MLDKLEFETVMKTMDIDEPEWYELLLPFNSTSYNVIRGKIPYKVAKKVSMRYPNKQEYSKIGKKRKYDKDDKLITYLTRYIVDSKEELVSLLVETQCYYNNIKNNRVKENNIVSEVNGILIEYTNPYEKTDEWLSNNNMTKACNNKDVFDILMYVDEFDNIVNPFSNDYFEIKDTSEYIRDLSLSFSKEDENHIRMKIRKDNIISEYEKNAEKDNNYLNYTLYNNEDYKTIINIRHHISQKDNENSISINTYQMIGLCYLKSDYDFKYDLISGLTFKNNINEIDKKPITQGQKIMLLKTLKEAITIGENKILNNMIIEPKQYVLKKK